MSESEQEAEEVTETFSSDGIYIQKAFKPAASGVPTVRLKIVSQRDDEAEVRLIDHIPGEVDVSKVGFHPEYGQEHWSKSWDAEDHPDDADGRAVAFTKTFSAGESFKTLYGVKGLNVEADPIEYLTEPDLYVNGAESEEEDLGVSPDETDEALSILDDSDTDGGSDTDESVASALGMDPEEAEEENDEEALGDALTPSGDEDRSPPGQENGAADDADDDEAEDDDEGADADNDSVDEEDAIKKAEERLGMEDGADSDAAPGQTVVDGSLADALVQELRNGNTDTETRQALAEELKPELDRMETSSAEDVEVSHMQRRLAELEAYIDSMKEFIDENGTGEEIVGRIESDLDSVKSDVRDFRRRLEGVEGYDEEITHLDERLESVEGDTSQLNQQMESVSEQADTLSEKMDSVDSRLTTGEERLDGVEQGVDDVDEELDEVQNDLLGRIEDIRGEVQGLEADVTAVEEFTDEELEVMRGELDEAVETVESVSDDVESAVGRVEGMEGDVESLKTSMDDVDVLEGRVEGIEEDVADLREELEDVGISEEVEDQLESVEQRVESLEDVGDRVESQVEDLRDDVEELVTFRKRMEEVIGGSRSGDSDDGSDSQPSDEDN